MPDSWPALPFKSWADTYATLHMWTQIVGKIRLALTPLINHWWNVPLYVSARGLTTSSIPYQERAFEIQFDFIDHRLVLETNDGQVKTMPLRPLSVADFYQEFMDVLRSAGVNVKIWRMPVEVPDPTAFTEDHIHVSYDPESAHKVWQVLVSSSQVLTEFRSRFIGKCSPVHFFWGSFDLAVTRFSGRRAPARPGADVVTLEAYSHEVSSVGFWPGNNTHEALFYSYAAPAPDGFAAGTIRPSTAFYDKELGEFVLPYENVRRSSSPRDVLLDFCQSTYEVAATLGKWDREALERQH
ncbi:MAG TPA: DUF5996 family protein [Terriglobales bacterium]|nr:DUF5996 family protein [Terriglobales bacterium]